MKVEQVESIVPDGPQDAKLGRWIRRYGSHGAVLGVGHGVAERGDPRLGGETIAGRKHLDVDAVTAKGSSQSQHLGLNAAPQTQAVGTDHADAQLGSPFQMGSRTCHCSGARRISGSSAVAHRCVSAVASSRRRPFRSGQIGGPTMQWCPVPVK